VEFISGIKISSLTKMQKDGLILMDNQSIKITNKGREENEKTLDKGPEA
jgi:Mn-dependent DtxR family transcriptional regulator